ncbi:hypothetical protein LTR85_005191 [Meristemomyces frigidus]|nr:hypothetical protein LTR85_005191 [Meristemomyces frigidus]
MTRGEIAELAVGHLGGKPIPYSIHLMDAVTPERLTFGGELRGTMAWDRARQNHPCQHHGHQAVGQAQRRPLRASHVCHIERGSSLPPHEFLAFGVITSECCMSVPYTALAKLHVTGTFYVEPSTVQRHICHDLQDVDEGSPYSIESTVGYSRPIVQLCGPLFELPMIVYLLAFRDRGSAAEERILKALSSLDVPQEWSLDLTITTQIGYTGGFKDAERAIGLLRELVKNKHDKDEQSRKPPAQL